MLGVLDRVLGHYQLSAPTGIQIGPGERAQVLHRDQSVYPLPADFPTVVVNTMWALDDFTEANGATRLVPGSHRGRRAPARPDDEVVTADHAGRLGRSSTSGRLWHGGGANRTDRPRLGVILEYVAVVAAGAGEPPPRPCPARSSPPCPNACRSCSATTSTRRSSATSTAATPGARSPHRHPSAPDRADGRPAPRRTGDDARRPHRRSRRGARRRRGGRVPRSTSTTGGACSPRRTRRRPPGSSPPRPAACAWLRRGRGGAACPRSWPWRTTNPRTSCWSGSTRAGPNGGTDADFGAGLAALHRSGAPCFGREDRRTTGSRGLPNEPAATWAEFYGQSRLLPLAKLARDAGVLPADDDRPVWRRWPGGCELFGAADEPPARLHGDLWAGNRLVDATGAAGSSTRPPTAATASSTSP